MKVDVKDIVGAHEIAQRHGLAFPNVVHSWRTRHEDFPEPIIELKAGIFWNWKEIEQWLKATNRIKEIQK